MLELLKFKEHFWGFYENFKKVSQVILILFLSQVIGKIKKGLISFDHYI